MPKMLRDTIVQIHGLPTDEDIKAWRDKLQLCVEAIGAELSYERYLSLNDNNEELSEESEDWFSEGISLYKTAIAALNTLLEGGEA